MKTDFSINVQVNLGVTPEIVALVNAILCHRPTVAPTAEEALDGNGRVDNKPEDTTPAQPQQPTNKRGRKKKEEAAADKPDPTKEPAGDEQQEALLAACAAVIASVAEVAVRVAVEMLLMAV